ncbi:MAG: AMP-binding protein [Bacteroidota bacterium]|nr:AMP-binding protein [Bacteroidota bacterium]
MKYQDVNSIKINGEFLAGKELTEYCRMQLDTPYLANWKEFIFNFLLEWLDDIPYINSMTSGSTGEPKSISLHKQHMINSALKTGEYLGLKENDKALLCLPAEYIAGKMMLVRSMLLGMDLSIREPKNDPLEETDPVFDFAAMVPLQVHDILQQESGYEKLNRIRKLIIGGGPVPHHLREKIAGLGNETYSTYGMTETVSHIAMEKLNGPEADGYYHLLPAIEIETDEKDRLIIHAPDIADEVIKTNDLVSLKDDKSFKVLGRFDNIIISGGIKIIPELIEKRIEKYISKRFIISSLPDEKLGEKVVLVIEDMAWDEKRIAELREKYTSELKKYERPKEISFVREFKETGSGKVERRKTRD